MHPSSARLGSARIWLQLEAFQLGSARLRQFLSQLRFYKSSSYFENSAHVCQTSLVSKKCSMGSCIDATTLARGFCSGPAPGWFPNRRLRGRVRNDVEQSVSNCLSSSIARTYPSSIAARGYTWERCITIWTSPQHSRELHREVKLWKTRWRRS